MNVNNLFSSLMIVFGLVVVAEANNELYGYPGIGYIITLGMAATVTGLFYTLENFKKGE